MQWNQFTKPGGLWAFGVRRGVHATVVVIRLLKFLYFFPQRTCVIGWESDGLEDPNELLGLIDISIKNSAVPE